MAARALASILPFHYGWAIALNSMLVTFSCLGLGRLALGMLLPSMGDDLGLSYSQMGYISTGNFIGYLLAVAAAPSLIGKMGCRKTIVLGLLTIGASTAAMSQISIFAPAIFLYLLTGFGSGLANIPAMALLAHWFLARFRGRAMGIAVIGSGFAIMLAGLSVPEINLAYGAQGWRYGWLGIGLLSVLVALVNWLLIRDYPADLGILSIGESKPNQSTPIAKTTEDTVAHHRKLLVHVGLIYLAFGATYITYGTFIVTTLIKEHGFSETVAGNLWFWIGFGSLFSGLVFAPLSDRLGRKKGLILVYGVQTIAYALAGFGSGGIALYISIGLYGMAVFSIPAIISAMVGDYLGAKGAAAGISFITFFFAAGQIAGPASAGIAADMVGSFGPVYGFCALVTTLAIFGCLLLKSPDS
jgi:MFS family permease